MQIPAYAPGYNAAQNPAAVVQPQQAPMQAYPQYGAPGQPPQQQQVQIQPYPQYAAPAQAQQMPIQSYPQQQQVQIQPYPQYAAPAQAQQMPIQSYPQYGGPGQRLQVQNAATQQRSVQGIDQCTYELSPPKPQKPKKWYQKETCCCFRGCECTIL
eukprot:23609_1